MAHIEREIKLGLTSQALPRLARLAPQRRSVASVYYDTARQELRRAGIALRLRRDGGRWLQTLKSQSSPHAGLAARSEWELPVRGKALEPGRFPQAEIRSATGVDLARVARRLRPVFETRFTRRSGLVELDGGANAELCIDQGLIVSGKLRERINEVELELISGDTRALLGFAEGLALPLAYESKAERGYRLAAGLPRAPRKWRMPEIDAAGTPAAAFEALFSAALTQVGVNAAGMRGSRDPEYLHQLRVGLRRLRSALRAFAPILKELKPLTRSIRRFMPALGAARDWDVFAVRLGAVPNAAASREAARREALAVVASDEFQAFLFHALRWLQSGPWRECEATLRDFAPGRLERLHRRTVRALEGKSARRRHKLRIRVKRLRYACEFFAPCFLGSSLEAYTRPLAALQDILGELNDIAVARKFLKTLGTSAPRRLETRERQLMTALRAARECFEHAPQYWQPQA